MTHFYDCTRLCLPIRISSTSLLNGPVRSPVLPSLELLISFIFLSRRCEFHMPLSDSFSCLLLWNYFIIFGLLLILTSVASLKLEWKSRCGWFSEGRGCISLSAEGCSEKDSGSHRRILSRGPSEMPLVGGCSSFFFALLDFQVTGSLWPQVTWVWTRRKRFMWLSWSSTYPVTAWWLWKDKSQACCCYFETKSYYVALAGLAWSSWWKTGCPWIYRDSPPSASLVLELKVCHCILLGF